MDDTNKELKPAARKLPPAAGMGRRKGSLNKTTALLKDAILQAASAAGGEGDIVGYLTLQAHQNPTAFLSLLGKVLPLQVRHADSDGGKIEIKWQS